MPVEYTQRYKRVRIQSPRKFDKRSFRTIDPGRPGYTKVIVACPKGQYNRKTDRCKVGLQQQSVLYERVKSHNRQGKRVKSYTRKKKELTVRRGNGYYNVYDPKLKQNRWRFDTKKQAQGFIKWSKRRGER